MTTLRPSSTKVLTLAGIIPIKQGDICLDASESKNGTLCGWWLERSRSHGLTVNDTPYFGLRYLTSRAGATSFPVLLPFLRITLLWALSNFDTDRGRRGNGVSAQQLVSAVHLLAPDSNSTPVCLSQLRGGWRKDGGPDLVHDSPTIPS